MKIRNIIAVAFVLIAFTNYSNKTMAQTTESLKSNGRIVFNKEMENQGKELIVFDADDLSAIQDRMSKLNLKIEEVRKKI